MALVAAPVATIASATFCRRLYVRWARPGRRNPALLAWTISLAFLPGVVIVGALIASARPGWTTLAEQRRGGLVATGRRRHVDALAGGVLDGWRALGRVGLDHIAKGNLPIMAGVVVAAGSGGMFSFLGDAIAHAIGLGVGVVIMYAGFERTTRPAGHRSIPGPVPPSTTSR